eukprot:PhM_4_TR13420/c0_g1_i1/m.881
MMFPTSVFKDRFTLLCDPFLQTNRQFLDPPFLDPCEKTYKGRKWRPSAGVNDKMNASTVLRDHLLNVSLVMMLCSPDTTNWRAASQAPEVRGRQVYVDAPVAVH